MIMPGKTAFTDVVGDSLMNASHADTLATLVSRAVAAIATGLGAIIRPAPAVLEESDHERLRRFK